MNLRHTIDYFKNFFKDRKVASVTPCSRFTIKRLCNRIDFSKASTVVEYGPGTGNFSAYMLDQLPSDARLILIELMEGFVTSLKKDFAHDGRVTIYQDGAENLPAILEKEGIEEVDAVLSGIPFSMLPKQQRQAVVQQTYGCLKPRGQFLLYQTSYMMVPYLREKFSETHKDFETRNVPPMCLMEGVK